MDSEKCKLTFEREYFTGKNRGVSNYIDYREKKHSAICDTLIKVCNITKKHRIIDFGCATGALLHEFKKRGFNRIKGTDVSYWAIEWGKQNLGLKKELDYYNRNMLTERKDFVIMLDVLEHIPSVEEIRLILKLTKNDHRGFLIVRIPVAVEEGQDYYLKVSRNDKTHVQCHCKEWWIKLFEECGYNLVEEFRHKNVIWSSKGVFTGVLKSR